MFSRWIWGIFNIQIQSDTGHELVIAFIFHTDKYQVSYLVFISMVVISFCMPLLTDRHLKVGPY